ncbi:hypothetical protein GCM10025298_22300 [Natronobiforma cellulositropha]
MVVAWLAVGRAAIHSAAETAMTDPGRPDSEGGAPSSDATPDPAITRRALLGGAGATVLSALGATTSLTAASWNQAEPASATVHVRVYPGPMPVTARLGAGRPDENGLFSVHRDALEAVEGALEGALTYAGERGVDLDAVVEPGGPVAASFFSRLETAVRERRNPSAQETVLDAFRDELREREVLSGTTCHLLLWWNPFNYDLGYGGTRSPNGHVTAVDGEGSQTVANVGATEFWDSRAVTRNIAIHETLHTFLSRDVVSEVVGSGCDHDLGSAIRREEGDETVLEISPMATAYAGPDEFGGGTRFHGTGCYDHDSFSRHDGTDDVDRFVYTTDLSEATLEALTRYLERHLG